MVFENAIPPEVFLIYSGILDFQKTLNFLNIHIRFEVVMITTDDLQTYLSSNAESTWVPSVLSKVPDYTRDDLFDYHSAC